MLSASLTEGTSIATISRSRASITLCISSRHQPRHVDEPGKLRAEQVHQPRFGEIIHVVERHVCPRDRDLLWNDQGATAELKDLPERHQRAQAPVLAGGGGRDREDSVLEGGVGRIAFLAYARNPVDRVLQ